MEAEREWSGDSSDTPPAMNSRTASGHIHPKRGGKKIGIKLILIF